MTQPVLFAVTDGEHSEVTESGIVVPSNNVFLPNKCDKGDFSEEAFDMAARLRGYIVTSGRGKGRDLDSIVKRPHLLRPVSVQTKLAQWKRHYSDNWYYQVNCSQRGNPYSLTAFDILAVHLADTDQFVFYTRVELGNRVGLVYLPEHLRKRKANSGSLSARDPDNWELLDQIATADSQESSTPGTADVPCPA
jgi:hypothetical protein